MSEESYAEVGRYEFGPNGKVILSKSEAPITFYKIHWLWYTWVACLASAGKGCAALAKAKLSLDKSPPVLRDQPPPPPTPPKTRQESQADRDRAMLLKLLKAGEAIEHWWTKPMPSLLPPRRTDSIAPAPTPAPSPAERPVPPFDLQDIPNVMDRRRLPVSAKMMRHWFAGQSNYSRTGKDATKGIDQNGKPFPANMIDHSIIDLDWVLGFTRAKAAFDELIAKAIYAPNAMAELRMKLMAFIAGRKDPFASFDGMSANSGDLHRLHSALQFQFVQIDATLLEKAIQWLAGDARTIVAPDDLTGALGSFSFYAAPGVVYFNHASRVARLESIYVYVRDSYSFLDDDPRFSQYLGHWSHGGVYLAPTPKLGQGAALGWMNAPLVEVEKSIYEKGTVMYPVTNKSFRDWRDKHGQGGDFIAYSKPRKVGLGSHFYVSVK